MNINNNSLLTYCTNIHPGETWDEHFSELKKNLPSIKSSIAPSEPMAVGLRLSDLAAKQLEVPEKIEEFSLWLKANNFYVPTMNGFPFGKFHSHVVKDNVHAPDWLTKERIDYTIRLANLLSNLLPDNMEGSISTSPGTYRFWHIDHDQIKKEVAANMWIVVSHLNEIYNAIGKIIHLDPEPEPDGLLETGDEFLQFYSDYLIPQARLDTGDKGEEILRRHLRLCLDVCHFAVGYENVAETFSKYERENVPIGKIQVSSALRIVLSDSNSERNEIHKKLQKFAEPVYLHQVVQLNTDRSIKRYRDLPDALNNIYDPKAREWRIHYHVPVFAEKYEQLQSTSFVIEETFQACKDYNYSGLLEVETYTWEVLPKENRPGIKDCIVRELEWVKQSYNKIHMTNNEEILG